MRRQLKAAGLWKQFVKARKRQYDLGLEPYDAWRLAYREIAPELGQVPDWLLDAQTPSNRKDNVKRFQQAVQELTQPVPNQPDDADNSAG